MKCLIPECTRASRKRGWCSMHYDRWRRNGNPLVTRKTMENRHIQWRSLKERIATRVIQNDAGCWIWQGPPNHRGYGMISYEERPWLAHRAQWVAWFGPIPEGMTVDHECHNRDGACLGGLQCLHKKCVNPDHLSLKTAAENKRAAERSRLYCRNGHAWTPENIYIAPSTGARSCRLCRKEYKRRKRQEGRAESIAASAQ